MSSSSLTSLSALLTAPDALVKTGEAEAPKTTSAVSSSSSSSSSGPVSARLDDMDRDWEMESHLEALLQRKDDHDVNDDMQARQEAEHDVLGTRSSADISTSSCTSSTAVSMNMHMNINMHQPPRLYANLASWQSTNCHYKTQQQQSQQQHVHDATTNNSHDDTTDTALRFHQALQQVPPAARHAYEHALRHNPTVVHRETPLHRFLLHNRGEYAAAAHMLARYWSTRQKTFGHDRYHLPLTLDGRGAMHPEAAAALQNGVCAILTANDQAGRVVWMIDGKFRNEYCLLSIWRAQIVFYMLQALSEHEAAVRNGFVMLACSDQQEDPSPEDKDDRFLDDDDDDDDSSTCSSSSIDDGGEPRQQYTLEEEEQYTRIRPAIHPEHSGLALLTSKAFPVQIKALHYVHPIRKEAPTRLTQFISSLWNVFIKTFFAFLNLRYRVHTARSVKELTQSLAGYGFLPQHHFPRRWGGRADGLLWYLLRLQKELQHRNDFEQDNEQDTSSSPLLSEPREDFLKRKMDEFHHHNQIQFLKYEIKKLQAAQKSLQESQQLLAAQWHCAQHFANKHDQDLEMIQERLQGELRELFTRQQDQATSDEQESQTLSTLSASLPRVSRQITTQSLVFHGRNCFTGQWEFQKNGEQESSLEEEHWTSSLSYLQERIQSWDPLGMEFQHRQKRLKQESESVVPPSPRDEDDELDKDIHVLQTQVARLKAEKRFLEQDERLIDSVALCFHQITSDYLAHCQEYRPALANAIPKFLSLRSGLPTWLLLPFDFGKVADRLMSQFVFVGKQQMRASFRDLTPAKLEALLQRDGQNPLLLLPSWISSSSSSNNDLLLGNPSTVTTAACSTVIHDPRPQEEDDPSSSESKMDDRKIPGRPRKRSRGSNSSSPGVTSSTVTERKRQVFQRRKDHLKRL